MEPTCTAFYLASNKGANQRRGRAAIHGVYLTAGIFKPRAPPERRLAKAAYLSHHTIIVVVVVVLIVIVIIFISIDKI